MPEELTRQRFLLAGAGTMAGLTILALGACSSEDVGRKNVRREDGEKQPEETAAPSGLEVFGRGYPRAFSFLPQADRDLQVGDLSYEDWEGRPLP